MQKLEDFVKGRKGEFDSKLPSSDLWGEIESQLDENSKIKLSFWKIAASLAAVLLLGFLTTSVIKKHDIRHSGYGNISDPELVSLLETETFYARKVSLSMDEINKCYHIYPELKSDLESDLDELDGMYKELKKDLKDNIYNREVIEAMIQNNRIRLKMVDRVLNQINC